MRPLLISLLAIASAVAAEPRTWTDSLNRKIEASLVRVDGDNVLLKLKDGREVPYPLAKLSQADRDFVASVPVEKPENMPEGGTSDDLEVAGKVLNFSAPWPERITFTEDPEITTVEESPTEKRFIYESANYRYVCDVRLSKMVVKGFAVMFEATNLYCATVPLALNGGKSAKGKHEILLFENKEDYVKAGGPPSSAGVFIGGKNIVMVPLESLGVRPVGSGYMLDRDKSNKTLPHELVHQLTPRPYYSGGARGWFTEGIAEYISVTPYRAGSYNVRNNFRDLVQYATGYGEDGRGGRALGTEITLPSLKKWMLMPYEDFVGNPSTTQINYGCAMLITTYFIHLDGKGDGARLKAFLKALREGKEEEEALAVLLDGRTFEQLEQDIKKAWGSKRVDFTFKSGGE
ncbi:SHD1 domain-containing protein [Luteolibacter sp. SL250]|uniref:SHD1 domain-containing protein n=1 Tax=Luteolibacter sp. SL250 TaxID=2995170 RepID=UPI0022721F7B|nr:SHD1 domain-containing protein [Luteolibacter sp. SL250]WAC19397.1 SHD1 domain-containing protein [Luteolibacter sp. SL250]